MKSSKTAFQINHTNIETTNTSSQSDILQSLKKSISPPPPKHRSDSELKSASAKVEVGELVVEDHVSFFSSKLLTARRPDLSGQSRLSHHAWLSLYERNLNDTGHHFVIHQHDHPVAGTHYDLRLQCNATSSISFAIMYGLPGDPNSKRLNRNAIETRVHNIWNHLIETASHQTGTMLIWDTGEYAVLPYHEPISNPATDNDEDLSEHGALSDEKMNEPGKLRRPFQQHKIKLRLNGSRLPEGYTIILRMSKENDRDYQPKEPAFRRRRKRATGIQPGLQPAHMQMTDSEESNSQENYPKKRFRANVSSLNGDTSNSATFESESIMHNVSDQENENIRLNNAYTGASNSIGSIHQRRWYLSLDRHSSGFVPTQLQASKSRVWMRKILVDGTLERFGKFHVLGREVERSILTGRLAEDILRDENITGYVPRGLWRPVTE